MSNYLVTGGCGFIGSHLCDALLARGDRVAMIDNFAPFYDRRLKAANIADAEAAGARVVEGDITIADDLDRACAAAEPDVIVHLAAWAGVRPSIQRPSLYAAVNVTGTQQVIDAARRHGVGRLVVASSSSVYGNNRKVPFSELDDVSRPISPYAATKVATELLCRTAAHLHDLHITALRFFTVFGPRQRPDLAISMFLARVGLGREITVFGDGETSRDYTFVGDIVAGILAAADRCGGPGGSGKGTARSGGDRYRCYNLGGDHPVRLAELIAMVERVTGEAANVRRLPTQPGDVERTWADLTRSRADLGYSPKTTLEEGLARQWEWIRADDRRLEALLDASERIRAGLLSEG